MSGFRSITVVDALDVLFTHLEQRYQPDPADGDIDSRIETGVPAIDQLLGGVPTGRVTLIAFDQTVHADALAASIVRNSPQPVLFAAPDLRFAICTVVAATAQVPYAFIESGMLSEDDWDKIHVACSTLRDRPIHFATCPSAAGIMRFAHETDSRLVVVLDPERLDADLDDALNSLATEVRGGSLAVVALTAAKTEDADAVVLAPSALSSTLDLVTSDPVDLLRRTTISVDRLSRLAR